MSILATAKSKAARGNVKEAFKNEAGAIDLASIMVGIIVIGLIGGVIAATVFAVIPWAQDNAAKQQLDSVVSAQSAYIGLSTDGGTQSSFGKAIDLKTKGLFDNTNAGVEIAVAGNGNTAHYGAVVKSASGNVFFITDVKTQPTTAAGADTVAKVTAAKTAAATQAGATFGTWAV